MMPIRLRAFCLLVLAPCILTGSVRSVGRGATLPQPVRAAFAAAVPPAQGGSPWSRLRKPLHQVVACFGLVMGVTGVLLAFASGPLVPVVAWAVAGVALQVCGG